MARKGQGSEILEGWQGGIGGVSLAHDMSG
jgi:hypothetical protein